MSKFAKKHNAALVRLFTFEAPEHFEYKSLADIAAEKGLDAIHKINAIYINKKGKYGDQPVLATDSELVNAPHHLLESVLDILEDAESVATINNGHAGFKIYSYENKHGTNYALEWADIA